MRIEQRISRLEAKSDVAREVRTIMMKDRVWGEDDTALVNRMSDAVVKRFRDDTGFAGECIVLIGTEPGARPAGMFSTITGSYEDLSEAKRAKSVFELSDAALMAVASGAI